MGNYILIIGPHPISQEIRVLLQRSNFTVKTAAMSEIDTFLTAPEIPSLLVYCDHEYETLRDTIFPKLLLIGKEVPVLVYQNHGAGAGIQHMYPVELVGTFRDQIGEYELITMIRQHLKLAHKFNEYRWLVRDIRKTYQELSIFRKIDRSVLNNQEQKKILREILEKITEFIKAEAWSFLVYNEESQKLFFEITAGTSEKEIKDFSLELGQGIAGWVAQHRIPLVVPDVSVDTRFFRSIDKITHFNTRCVLAVPLIVRGKLVGVVELVNRLDGKPFDENDLKIMQTISMHAAIALETAVLYQMTRELSVTDDLTGLYNARFLRDSLEREIQSAQQRNSTVSFIFMDLDHFKKINDVHGHLRGRAVLKEVAGRIQPHVRENDIVARYGGDEFVIVMPDAGAETAMQVAEKIRKKIKNGLFLKDEGLDLSLTASFGVATFPINAKSKNDLINMADEAMFSAKRKKRDSVYMAHTDVTMGKT